MKTITVNAQGENDRPRNPWARTPRSRGLVRNAAIVEANTVTEGDNRTVQRGDDVTLEWSDAEWPDLVGGGVVLGVNGAWGYHQFDGVVVDGTSVKVVLSDEETSALQGAYTYDLQAILSDGRVQTLVRGGLTASETYTDRPENSENQRGWLV